MSVEMTRDEMVHFLAQPRIAKLGTVLPSGWPQVTPMWFEYDAAHDVILMSTTESRIKVANIGHDNRVCVSVDEANPPYKGVIIWGRAEISREVAAPRYIVTLALRYMGEAGRGYGEAMAKPDRVLIKIRPERIVTWDFAKR